MCIFLAPEFLALFRMQQPRNYTLSSSATNISSTGSFVVCMFVYFFTDLVTPCLGSGGTLLPHRNLDHFGRISTRYSTSRSLTDWENRKTWQSCVQHRRLRARIRHWQTATRYLRLHIHLDDIKAEVRQDKVQRAAEDVTDPELDVGTKRSRS